MTLETLIRLEGGDEDEQAENNEEAAAVGPEGGFYNSDAPGENEGISNAQQ